MIFRRLAIAAALALLTGSALAASFDSASFDTGSFETNSFDMATLVTVPNCTSSPTAQAACVSSVEGAGFTTTIVSLCSDSVASGNVISTTPPAGDDAEGGSAVIIRVSNGSMCETPKGRRVGLGMGLSIN